MAVVCVTYTQINGVVRDFISCGATYMKSDFLFYFSYLVITWSHYFCKMAEFCQIM